MSFQNPQLLYGLFALIIPVLIHFFNFRKTRKVYFSNTKFLQRVKETTSTRKRLKHFLILASRLLFVFFLVIAFAQPFIPAPENTVTGDPVTVYLDNSWSMSNEVDDGITALDRSIGYLDELLRRFPPTTQYRLLTNDFLASSRTLKSSREMEELITEVKYSGIPRSANEILSRIDSDVADGKSNVFWLSDFQESTLGTIPSGIDSTQRMNLVPLTFSNQSNVFIDSLFVENPIMLTDEQVKLHVIFGLIGSSREVIAKVYLDEVQSATANVALPANGTQEVIFDLSVDRTKPHRGRVVFEEFPVTFDNEFNFVLNIPESINILEIKGRNEITPVELVYSNNDLFNLISQPADNLDYNQIELSDLVVLNGLNTPDMPLIGALNRYLRSGGTLLLIPGSDADTEIYRQISGLGMLQKADSSGMTALEAPDYDNPFFENVFEERTDRLQMPSSKPVYRIPGPSEAILKYPDNRIFLGRIQSSGDLFFMTSPLDDAFSGFSRHALFVPVMYKIAAAGKKQQNELYRFINRSTFSLKQDSAALDVLYRLVREDEEIVPQQRVDGNRIYFEVPRFTLSPGFYELYQGDKMLGLVAFNTDPEESDIRQPDRQEVRAMFQGDNIDILQTDGQADFAGLVSEKYIGKTLWKQALLLALLFLLAEVLLIRFMP